MTRPDPPLRIGLLRLHPERYATSRRCEDCQRECVLVKGFVYRAKVAHAVYIAACHDHVDGREAVIDVVLGTFGHGAVDDHVTFGARVGGQSAVVDAAATYGDSAIFGHKLDREAALSHERFPEYQEVVDFIVREDVSVHRHLSAADLR